MKIRSLIAAACLVLTTLTVAAARAGDCPQWGGSPARNNVSEAKNLPGRMERGPVRREDRPLAPRVGQERPLGRPARLADLRHPGRRRRQGVLRHEQRRRLPEALSGHGRPRLPALLPREATAVSSGSSRARSSPPAGPSTGPQVGICGAPLVEGEAAVDRHQPLRSGVRGRGQADRHADAPPKGGSRQADPLGLRHDPRTGRRAAQHEQLLGHRGRRPAAGRARRNGVDESHDKMSRAPRPPASSPWTRRPASWSGPTTRPGANILHGQWSSPAFAVIGGVPQAIFAGGDGWVYSFPSPKRGAGGRQSPSCCGSSTAIPRRRSGRTAAGATAAP